VESGANQVSGAFSGGIVSGADSESGEDRQCFRRKCQNCFQLQTIAKISAFFSVSQVEIARLVLKLLKIEPAYTIAIDRTEWQLGAQWINVLMLAVNYQGVSIPLLWTVTDEKGCSDNAERKAILQKFIDEFGVERIKFVTCEA